MSTIVFQPPFLQAAPGPPAEAFAAFSVTTTLSSAGPKGPEATPLANDRVVAALVAVNEYFLACHIMFEMVLPVTARSNVNAWDVAPVAATVSAYAVTGPSGFADRAKVTS